MRRFAFGDLNRRKSINLIGVVIAATARIVLQGQVQTIAHELQVAPERDLGHLTTCHPQHL